MPKAKSTKKHHILVLQGPNMNYLGKRQPELYGTTTAAELDEMMREHARRNGYKLSIFYTNSEGAGVDRLYQAVDEGVDGLVMNPASWSFDGHAMRFCLLSINLPYIEVHIRSQYKMKHVSTLAEVAIGVIQGFGVDSYLLGLDAMLRILNRERK